MKEYSVKEELKQSFMLSMNDHPWITAIFCCLLLVPLVFGALCILTIPMENHAQNLKKIEQEQVSGKDAWGASIIESMSDIDSIKTQETVHYYMDVRSLDDGSKEVRIQNKDSEPQSLKNATLYYIVYKDFSYTQVQSKDKYEFQKRFSEFKHN